DSTRHAACPMRRYLSMGDDEATSRLIDGAVGGDRACLGQLLERHRDRLRRMVSLRIDPGMSGRVDPSDVIREAYLETSARLPEYAQARSMPFFLWLRLIAGQRLRILHRHHLGVQARDAGREVEMGSILYPGASFDALAAHLAAGGPSPSEAARRDE